MSGENRTVFELRLGSFTEDELAVTRISGAEALSEPFAFEVDFFPVSEEEIDLGPLLAAEARLSLRRPEGGERWVHGICARIEHRGLFAGKPRYRAVLAPKLVLLGETRDSRIFQLQSVPEIVKVVLDENRIAFQSKLRGSYPKREMCVQYGESCLAFVSRLLEEEGIAYWFAHDSDGHVLVLGDDPKAFAPLPEGEELPYRVDVQAAGDVEYLCALRRSSRVKPAKSTLRDFDFERPALDVTAQASDGAGDEVYDYPGGFVEPAQVKRLSGTRLEELRFGTETWRGEGTCQRLAPGCVFEVSGHPEPSFDVRLLAVRVEHEGRQQTSAGDVAKVDSFYRSRFLAIREGRPYRPRRKTKRPVISGPQTATVVSAGSEEVWVDEHARIKVKFHWDRKGFDDDRASGWVRVGQSWAGSGFGTLFVPREGQEVLVRFFEGNPDRPFVAGAIYNGQNRPPVTLPHDKSRSTLKTDSSLGSGGSNELRFEDLKDGEEVYLHAQKDEKIEVGNDKTQHVFANEKLVVEKDRSRTVRGDQELKVRGDDASQIGGNQTLAVAGDRTTAVAQSHTETVVGSQTVSVGGLRTVTVGAASMETVGAAAALTIGGAYAVNVAGAYNEAVGAMKSIEVGAERIEIVGAARKETVGGDSSAKVDGDFASDVSGGVATSVGKDSKEEVSGRTQIQVKERVAWSAKKYLLEADTFTLTVGGKLILSLEKSGVIQFYGKSITVNGQAIKLRGAQIKKVAPAADRQKQLQIEQLEELRGARATAEFTLVDLDGAPVVNQAFRVEHDTGARKGATDGNGHVKVPLPKEGKFKVTLAGEPAPQGKVSPKGSAKGATRVELGKAYGLATGKNHLLELPERRNVMTVAYLFDGRPGDAYPKYVLESDDGAYRQERSPKDDLVKGDGLLQLRFDKLVAGKHYKLTKRLDAEHTEVLFEDMGYAQLVDQQRPETLGLAESDHGGAKTSPRRPK
jgi:type VI secretion system secreted protein VgrG